MSRWQELLDRVWDATFGKCSHTPEDRLRRQMLADLDELTEELEDMPCRCGLPHDEDEDQ